MSTENNKERRRQRLEKLMELSHGVSSLVKEGKYTTINQALIERCYRTEGHNEFHTFNEWKKLGAKIKKGAEAFCVWGKPKQVTVPIEDGDDKLEDFYPMAYIFSNQQVVMEGEN